MAQQLVASRNEETSGVFLSVERRRDLTLGLVLLLTFYAALITVPPLPTPFGAGLDPSWMLGLNLAHARNFVPGPDFIFTYGPLGYVIWPDATSGAPGAVLAYHLGLYLLWTAALFVIAITVRSGSMAFWVLPILAMGVIVDILGPTFSRMPCPLPASAEVRKARINSPVIPL